MTQDERLNFLIEYLIAENNKYRGVKIPDDREGRFNLYRSLVNMRLPAKASEEYLKTEDEYLREETNAKGITEVDKLFFDAEGLTVWQGDITSLRCDAIVNAANSQMLGCFVPYHNCIDNCIHTFSGIRLRFNCNEIMLSQAHEEPAGRAKITPAYNLPCRYIIHTVGPIVNGNLTQAEKDLLESCYKECLKKATENKLKSIAFCCISTGVFGFPQREAAEIAVKTVREYKKSTNSDMKVVFDVFKDEDLNFYQKILDDRGEL